MNQTQQSERPQWAPEDKAAILGYGVSGEAAAGLMNRLGIPFVAYDSTGRKGAKSSFSRTEAQGHPLVVFSPGFHQAHPWIEAARQAGCQLFGELDFASLFWEGEVVAVTGTNGKTTVTEFLAYVHQRNGKRAIAVGNNGNPFSNIVCLNYRAKPIAVVEVSSFQAESLHNFRADALIWTNFAEDHMDRYATEQEYFEAKWNLVQCLRRPLFLTDKTVVKAARKFGKKLPSFTFSTGGYAYHDGVFSDSSAFFVKSQRRNLSLICEYWKRNALPMNVLKFAAQRFAPREHRLHLVATINGARYWNDSKATNAHAVSGALEQFNSPVVWIGGGKRKGESIASLAKILGGRVKKACLIGESAIALAEALVEYGIPVRISANLQEAVRDACRSAKQGDDILFSPAFASFDAYKNYAERGECFEKQVQQLHRTFNYTAKRKSLERTYS